MGRKSHSASAVVVLGDDLVETTDESVATTDDVVRTTEDIGEPRVVTPALALEALREVFGGSMQEEYVLGKTRFRDLLIERFDLGDLEAEEMCDDLERARHIELSEEEDGPVWRIHGPDERLAEP